MLVVVKDRNLHGAPQFFLDDKTFRCFDVFQVDAAERRLKQLACPDDFLRVSRGELDIEHVDVREPLEQHALAFHHRLARERSDVAEPEHRRAIGDHCDKIALSRVLIGQARIFLDRQTGNRDARRVCQAQIALRETGLGGADRDLTRGRRGMVFERIFVAQLHSVSSGRRDKGKRTAAIRYRPGSRPWYRRMMPILYKR